MLPESTTILIVGAGPSGLSAALSLVQQGCRDILIVDAILQGENTSRALAIHAATLEALDSIGCADKLVKLGIKGKGIQVNSRASTIISTDFSILAPYTKFPYVLLLPQSETERILGEQLQELDIHVHRPYKVIGMKNNDENQSILEVSFDGGEVVKAKYVIGADGARSTIRQLTGIGFTDPDGDALKESALQMVLSDVTFSPQDPQIPSDRVVGTISGDGVLLSLPLSSSWLPAHESQKKVYRIIFQVPECDGTPPSSPPIEYLQKYVDRYGPYPLSSDPSINPNAVYIAERVWSSRFRTHAALADRFFTKIGEQTSGKGGIVVLVGDAAHIHSPAGGLGMNLGIRDAVGLGPVVAEHLKLMQSSPSTADLVLETYATTRHERAAKTIRLTKRLMNIVLTLRSQKLVSLQYWLIRILGSFPFVRRMLVWRLSGLGNR